MPSVTLRMTQTLIGYARCYTDAQDLTAQHDVLRQLGVSSDRIYTDHGLTGTNRLRPGLDQALAAVRNGDTLVVSKLDRLARSVPDARAIDEHLSEQGVRFQLGSTVHDPADPMGKMFFNILATFAEFEADLIKMRTREGIAVTAPKASYVARSQNYRPSSNGNYAGCTTQGHIQLVTWLNCFRSPVLRSIALSSAYSA